MSEFGSQSPSTILIVDDQPGIRRLLQELFHAQGYTVWLAAGGQQALALVSEHDIDVALIDVKMPGMGGLETLLELERVAPMLPVIMMTAYEETDVAESALQHGARGAIRKPFDLDLVKETVARVIAEGRHGLAAEAKGEYETGGA